MLGYLSKIPRPPLHPCPPRAGTGHSAPQQSLPPSSPSPPSPPSPPSRYCLLPDYALSPGRPIVRVSLFLPLSLESLYPLLAVSGINCSLAEKEAPWQWRVSISSSCSCWPDRQARPCTSTLEGEEVGRALKLKWINSPKHLNKREVVGDACLPVGPSGENRAVFSPGQRSGSTIPCPCKHRGVNLFMINQPVSFCGRAEDAKRSIVFGLRGNKFKRERKLFLDCVVNIFFSYLLYSSH